MSATIVSIDQDAGVIPDQGAHIDAFGQALLLGIFSDLCQLSDGETHPVLDASLNGITKRLGKLLERYEP